MSESDKGYWIAFNRVSGIGPTRLAALVEACGSVEAAWRAPIQQLQAARLDRRALENLLDARRRLDPAAEYERVQRASVQIVTLDDAHYPANLRQVDAAPPVLYVRGELSAADDLAVAIVGTRRASAYGREVAHNLAGECARAGVTVVSGLALGVDTVAHRAALEAGGRTIAVLGSGLDQLYPGQNRALADEIARQGAVVSDYPLGTRPEAQNFPPRNRIISGLSRAVAIVEAGQRSGALITAEFALDQGRDLYAVPGSILASGSVGCNDLIRQGAAPLLSPADLLAGLQVEQVALHREMRAALPPDPQEARLLAHLSTDPQHVDDIVRQSALPFPQVSSMLAMMELKGLVRQVGGMSYVKA